MNQSYRPDKSVWISLVRRAFLILSAISIFFFIFSKEAPPDFIFRFMIYGFISLYSICLLICIIKRILYKVQIFELDNGGFEVRERCLTEKRYSFKTASDLKLVIPTTLKHRLPFIRVDSDYDKEFGGLLGINTLKVIINSIEKTSGCNATFEAQLMMPRVN